MFEESYLFQGPSFLGNYTAVSELGGSPFSAMPRCSMYGIIYLHLPPKLPKLGGGFKYFLFSPLFGEDSQFD